MWVFFLVLVYLCATISNGQENCTIGQMWAPEAGGCLDINECASVGVCSPWATCTNTAGSKTCKCKTGFTGDGFTCTPTIPCDDGWITYPGSNSCYLFPPDKADYAESAEFCYSESASLVCLNDEEEVEFFAAHIKSSTWTGLSDILQEGVYRCPDGQEGLARRPWAQGQPNPDFAEESDCVDSLKSFHWGITDCNSTHFGACKINTFPCPEGWFEVQPGQCTLILPDALNFDAAEAACKEINAFADLYTMRDLEENLAWGGIIGRSLWLGYKKPRGTYDWKAVAQQDTGYRNWMRPDFSKRVFDLNVDFCALMLPSVWEDSMCTEPRAFVCEKPILS